MPTDLKLDPLTHDIDLSLGGEVFSDNIEVVAQRIKIAILLRKGEWFRNEFEGLPYQQEFFKRKNNKQLIDQTMIAYINDIEDVDKVINYTSTVDVVRRNIAINVTVQTYKGDIIPVFVGGN